MVIFSTISIINFRDRSMNPAIAKMEYFAIKDNNIYLFTIVAKSSIFLGFLDLLCTIIHSLQNTKECNTKAAKEVIKKVFWRICGMIWTLIFWFLSSSNSLRVLNHSQSLQKEVVMFWSVIILSKEKNTEYSCTWIYLNIFLSIIYFDLVHSEVHSEANVGHKEHKITKHTKFSWHALTGTDFRLLENLFSSSNKGF